MGRSDRRKVVAHQRVSVMECEDEATLVEVLQKLEGVDLHIQQLGVRALVFPAHELVKVRRALESQRSYPHIVGEALRTSLSEEIPEDDDE